MLLQLKDILDGPLRFDETLDLPRVSRDNSDFIDTPKVRLRGNVAADPEAPNTPRGAQLEGRLEGKLRLRCCRCLEPFDYPCASEFRFTLVTEAPRSRDSEHQIDARDTHFFEIEAQNLDLSRLAAELVHLNLPLKPVCEDTCAGLCATCGVNRNRLECDCREEAVDPRLQALQQIRDQMGGKPD